MAKKVLIMLMIALFTPCSVWASGVLGKTMHGGNDMRKAIIVAGGGPYDGNTLWTATRMVSNFAYLALGRQGFARENIYYLTPETYLDADGDGINDGDGDATLVNLEYAITTWALDADELFIYMADHGGAGRFRLNETEDLWASDFDDWLDAAQATIPGVVTLLYDACNSGSFIEHLAPPQGKQRCIVTSASPDQTAFFAAKGSLSFSYFFWGRLFLGDSFYDSYVHAKNSISLSFNQNPQLESNGNGIANESEDKSMARSIQIGDERSPDDREGDFAIRSLARASYMGASSDARREASSTNTIQKAIVVAGGGIFDGNMLWDAVRMNSNFAHLALIHQGFAIENIHFLSPAEYADFDGNGVNDVDGDATLANLEYAITSWALNADDLFIYLVAPFGGESFRINETEILQVDDLDDWLDAAQAALPGRVVVLHDAYNGGGFSEFLDPVQGKERCIVVSASEDEAALFADQGTLSFSFFFWGRFLTGYSLYDSYVNAKNSMQLIFNQNAQVEGNGNGLPNEDEDKALARSIQIGDERPNDEAPIIITVSPRQTIHNTTTATIRADIFDEFGIVANVRMEITPPNGAPASVALAPVGNDRYEAAYQHFETPGLHSVELFVLGAEGLLLIQTTTDVRVFDQSEVKYVGFTPGGNCGGNSPCFSIVSGAVASQPPPPNIILVEQGEYSEGLVLDSSGAISLFGGWGEAFSSPTSHSTFNSITIQNGTVVVENVVLK